MKKFQVKLEFEASNHVTIEFVRAYLEKLMTEKIHNPVTIEIEEVESPHDEKL